MKQYQTMAGYPQIVNFRGLDMRYVKCAHCKQHIWLEASNKLQAHEDPSEEIAWVCEGSGRFYFNMFGTRSIAESDWKGDVRENIPG